MVPILLREIAAGGRNLDPEAMRQMVGIFGVIRGILERGTETGELRPMHPLLTHFLILGSAVLYTANEPIRLRIKELRLPGGPRDVPVGPDPFIDYLNTVLRRSSVPRLRTRPMRSHATRSGGPPGARSAGFAGCRQAAPTNRVRVSGHVEATEVQVAPEVGGRLLALEVDEGDRVAAGQVIARLDTRDTELAIAREAERAQADAQLRLLRAGSRSEDVRQAAAQCAGAAAEVASAEADLASAEARPRALRGAPPLQRRIAQAARRCAVAAGRDEGAARGVRQRATAGKETLARVEAGARPQEIEAAARVSRRWTRSSRRSKSRSRDATITAPVAGLVTEKLADRRRAPRSAHAARRRHRPRSRVGRRVRRRAGRAAAAPRAGGHALHRRRGRRNSGHREVHLSEGGVHAAQRADRGGTFAPGLSRQDLGETTAGAAQAGDARRGGASRSAAAEPGVAMADQQIVFDGSASVTVRSSARWTLLRVAPGEMFGLIGPDGAGKTTTIRLMCGLLHADGGHGPRARSRPGARPRRITRSVGYLSQRFSLYGDLSIDENIAFFAEIHGLRDYAARRERLLELTQLTPFRDAARRPAVGRHETEAGARLHARARAAR